MLARAREPLALLTLLLVCLAGMSRATWWAVCAGACVMALISMSRQQAFAARWSSWRAAPSSMAVIGTAALNGSAASCASFALGYWSIWAWGLSMT